jgi:molybdopterin-guanine dinucleotide biosynthesis protein A
MGRPKHELPIDGATLLEWQVARLGRFFGDLIVVGAAAPVGARSVFDRRTDGGPLAGIEAGLLAMHPDSRAFVLACDMPRAQPSLGALLWRLCEGHDAAVPRVAGRAQPTCAAYARSAAPKLTAYLDAGERRATEALDRLDVVFVDEAELIGEGVALTELDDLDTPADYDAFLASLPA